MMRMHELLVGQFRGDGLVIDHINHNRTDNRKDNLRIVTPAQNARVVKLEEAYGRG